MPPLGPCFHRCALLPRLRPRRGQPPPQNIVETASLPVIIHLLRHSDLLTALPAESVGPYLQTGQMCVLPIELGVRMEFFGIIRRRDQLLKAERTISAAGVRQDPDRRPRHGNLPSAAGICRQCPWNERRQRLATTWTG